MADPVYTKFILTAALRAIDGDESLTKMLKRNEYRFGINALLEELDREIEGRNDEDSDPNNLIHLIVDATDKSKKDALKVLRRWMRDSKQVDIVDPYLLTKGSNWGAREIDKFAEDISYIVPERSTVNVFVNGYNSDVRKAVWNKLKEGRTVRIIKTNAYHDRFIITDDGVKLMGASFNGLGRKISALVDLDDEDASEIRLGLLQERRTGIILAGPSF